MNLLANFKRELWTRELLVWYLYDCANSFVTIVFTLYFSQWVIVDNKLTDLWLSVPFVIVTLILVFLSTHVGAIGDRLGNHNRIFVITTILSMASALGVVIVGRGLSPPYNIYLALILYGAYQFFIQLAIVPYYAFIKHISSPQGYDRVSGLGFTISQFGSIGGLLLSLLIIEGYVTLFGTDRLAPILLGLAAFIIVAIPPLLVLGRKRLLPVPIIPAPFFKSFILNLKSSRKYPGVFPLLLAYYFFSDAIATLSLFSAVYLQNVFGVDDAFKVNVYILILIGFAIGAFITGPLSDRFSHRKSLIVALILEGLSIISVALATSTTILAIMFFVFGVMMGSVYASSRGYLASLVPEKESGTYFGLYTFAERFASVLGPLIWGIIIWSFAGFFPTNYRIAAFVMGAITLLGAIPLMKIMKLFRRIRRFRCLREECRLR
ncbi:MAG: MFS transporter [Candidatus Vogelbacteria bacterium]|nr:MFS transporter [Candidatus Vogelbacteria bacterium]